MVAGAIEGVHTGVAMAGQAERTGRDYLYRRKPSPNWRLKLQYPTAELRAFATIFWGGVAQQTGAGFSRSVKAVEDISLGTADLNEARAMTTGIRYDLAPCLPPIITRVGSGPVGTGLQTRLW